MAVTTNASAPMPAKGLIRIIALSGFVSLISYNSNFAMAAAAPR
jgi:hypothetical protein